MLTDIPLYFTIAGRVTVQKFEWRDDLPREMFEIPADYHVKGTEGTPPADT